MVVQQVLVINHIVGTSESYTEFQLNQYRNMQNQQHSYAFPLTEGSQGSYLVCHPKQPLFVMAANMPKDSKCSLYALNYKEQNPRKSMVLKKDVEGESFGLFPIQNENIDFCCVGIFKDGEYGLHKCENDFFSNQDQQLELIYSSKTRIRDLILKKNRTEGFILCDSQIFQVNFENFSLENPVITAPGITQCTFDPLHQFLTYVTDGKQVHICDKINTKQKYSFTASKGSESPIVNLDYNPNKQYYLMTTHYEVLKFWDIRKGDIPVKCYDEHHSLLLNARYNPSHDEMLICSYDDGTISLVRMSSVSSSTNYSESEDALVRLYDEHEDSVYQLAWSHFSPWVFGTLSYSCTNFCVNVVPSVEKYRILL